MSFSIITQPVSQLVATGQPVTFFVTAVHSDVTATISYQWLKNGIEMPGRTSSSFLLSTTTTDDSEVYNCKIWNDKDNTVLYSSLAVLAASILDYIELNIKVAILGMTITGGYNWDWVTVNQTDEAVGQGYPRALIASPAETCKDDPNGPNAQAYTNDVLFVIMVRGSQAWTPNSDFAIRSNLRTAIEDLKKLFGVNSSVNGSCEEIMYRSHQVMALKQNDIQRPAYLVSQWLVRYTQDRLNPLQYASS
jgi:hypothetical protein